MLHLSECRSFTARTRSNLRKQHRNNLLFSLCFYMFMFIVQDVVYCLLYVATVSPVKYKFVFWMVNAFVEFSCQVHTFVSAQLSSERCFYDIKRHFIHESLSPSLCETAALVYKLNYPFFSQTNEPQNRWCVVRDFQDAKRGLDRFFCLFPTISIIHWHF